MNAIEARNLTKVYRLYSSPRDRLKEMLSFNGKKYHREFFAVRDVSFHVEKGQTVGIVGQNGSGKSTLLQMICGVVEPSAGGVSVNGRISALLELGAGFNPEFTGRENVFINGALMGFDREEMARRLPLIEEFAEIGEFIHHPVKTYSTGMFVRLAFAAAINVDPDVLVIDEALAVGDAVFQHRCIRKIKDLQRKGVTLLFVSHDTAAVKTVCHSAMLMDEGRLVCQGDSETVTNVYHSRVASKNSFFDMSMDRRVGEGRPSEKSAHPLYREGDGFSTRTRLFRHGSGAARIMNVEILDRNGNALAGVHFDHEMVLRVHLLYLQDVEHSILGYYLRDKNGLEIIGTNTAEEQRPLPMMEARQTLVVDFIQRLPLAAGTYSVTVALAYHDHFPNYMDWVDNACVLTVLPPQGKTIHSRVWLPVEIVIHPDQERSERTIKS